MYWSKKEENVIPWNFPNISTNKTKNTELIKGYFMQSNLLLIKEYKSKIKETDKITYKAGTCFDRKANPKNTGISTQYNFLWLFIANNKL